MNALKMAMFIFSFIIAAGIINGSGIFTTQIQAPNVTMPGADLATGIAEIDSGTSSTEDIEAVFNAGAMVLNAVSAFLTLFEVLLIPGYYLWSLDVPFSICMGIQSLVTISEVVGVIQFYSGRSTKGME